MLPPLRVPVHPPGMMVRIGNEHARPLLSQYLETAGRGNFIPYEEARKDWELD